MKLNQKDLEFNIVRTKLYIASLGIKANKAIATIIYWLIALSHPTLAMDGLQKYAGFWKALRKAYLIKFRFYNLLYRVWLLTLGVKDWLNELSFFFYRSLLTISLIAFVGIVAYFLLDEIGAKFIFRTPNHKGFSADFINNATQIVAVLVGLYLTALSVVVSTAYKNVSESVRRLLIYNRINRFYMFYNVLVLIISLIINYLNSYGYTFHGSVMICYLAMVIFSVIVFQYMGLGIFRFFSPLYVINTVNSKIVRNIKLCSSNSIFSKDVSHVDYIRQDTEDMVNRLKDIFNALKIEHSNSDHFYQLTRILIMLLLHYEQQKSLIPSDSLWFRKEARFDDWMFSVTHGVEIALRTDTELQPKHISNYLWLEGEFLPLIHEAYSIFLQRSELNYALKIADNLRDVVGHISSAGRYEEAILISKNFNQYIELKKQTLDNNIENDIKHILSINDQLTYNLVNVSLSTALSIDKVSKKYLHHLVGKIKRNKPNQQELPELVKVQMENLAKQAKAEAFMGCLTPNHYFYSKLQFSFCDSYKSLASSILASLKDEIGKLKLVKTVEYNEINLQLYIQRVFAGLLVTNKNQIFLKKWKVFIDNTFEDIPAYKDMRGKEESMIEEIEQNNEEVRKELILLLGKVLLLLTEIKHNPSHPDYVGRAYTYACNACIEALADNDLDNFKALMQPLFSFALLKALGSDESPLSPQEAARRLQWELDNLTICGLAYVYSELHGNTKFKDFINQLWKNLEDKVIKDGKGYWERYLNIMSRDFKSTMISSGLVPLMSPRPLARSNWERWLITDLKSKAGNDTGKIITYLRARNRMDFMAIPTYEFFAIGYVVPLAMTLGIKIPQDLARLYEEVNKNA